MLRRPPRFVKHERTFAEKLFAQWPGFIGLLSMAVGGLIFLAFRDTSSYLATRGAAIFFALGVAGIGYWALANRNDDYNSV
jgi:uncharacterized membrane protein HdeD (DUF308 family)